MCWEFVVRPGQSALGARPVKTAARVLFALRRNVLVARHVGNGVVLGDGSAQASKCFVLSVFEMRAFQAFEFNAYGVVISY